MIMGICCPIRPGSAFVMKAKGLRGAPRRKGASVPRILGIYNLMPISRVSLVSPRSVSVVDPFIRGVIGVRTRRLCRLALLAFMILIPDLVGFLPVEIVLMAIILILLCPNVIIVFFSFQVGVHLATQINVISVLMGFF